MNGWRNEVEHGMDAVFPDGPATEHHRSSAQSRPFKVASSRTRRRTPRATGNRLLAFFSFLQIAVRRRSKRDMLRLLQTGVPNCGPRRFSHGGRLAERAPDLAPRVRGGSARRSPFPGVPRRARAETESD